jgi:hypothetical protein
MQTQLTFNRSPSTVRRLFRLWHALEYASVLRRWAVAAHRRSRFRRVAVDASAVQLALSVAVMFISA